VYKVTAPSQETTKREGGEDQNILSFFGALERSSGADRCSSLAVNSSQSLLAAQSSGKFIDVFRIRDVQETKKKMKRRMKRIQSKESNKSGNKNDKESEDEEEEEEDEGKKASSSTEGGPLISDEIELVTTMKFSVKVRSFAFNPISFSDSEDLSLVSLVNNSLEIYKIPHSVEKGPPLKLSLIDLAGHRSDIRSLAVSSDGNSVATCSSEAMKLWSTRGWQCTASAYSSSSSSSGGGGGNSYLLSVAFVPGGRYVICGCKDGKLQVTN
jgi:U3 small nucleolar RNA-associated protein 12